MLATSASVARLVSFMCAFCAGRCLDHKWYDYLSVHVARMILTWLETILPNCSVDAAKLLCPKIALPMSHFPVIPTSASSEQCVKSGTNMQVWLCGKKGCIWLHKPKPVHRNQKHFRQACFKLPNFHCQRQYGAKIFHEMSIYVHIIKSNSHTVAYDWNISPHPKKRTEVKGCPQHGHKYHRWNIFRCLKEPVWYPTPNGLYWWQLMWRKPLPQVSSAESLTYHNWLYPSFKACSKRTKNMEKIKWWRERQGYRM